MQPRGVSLSAASVWLTCALAHTSPRQGTGPPGEGAAATNTTHTIAHQAAYTPHTAHKDRDTPVTSKLPTSKPHTHPNAHITHTHL